MLTPPTSCSHFYHYVEQTVYDIASLVMMMAVVFANRDNKRQLAGSALSSVFSAHIMEPEATN